MGIRDVSDHYTDTHPVIEGKLLETADVNPFADI